MPDSSSTSKALIGLAALLFAVSASAQTSVQGVVVDTKTGLPIPRAHVSLRSDGARQPFGALTTAEGKFSVDGIAPGVYDTVAERVGYVMGPETVLTLQPDEKKTDVILKLTPTGAIIGRITDSEGIPIEGSNVTVEGAGTHLLTTADDTGHFRIGGLAPGRYLVKAAGANDHSGSAPEIRTDGSEEVHNAATYFPGSIDRKGALRVQVNPGEDVTGIDIRLAPTRDLHVRGRVTGIAAGVERPMVSARAESGRNFSVLVKKDGTFELLRLDPGRFVITAQTGNSPEEILRSAGLAIEVGGSNIEGIELRLEPPADLTGRLEFDDDQSKQLPPPIRGKTVERQVNLRDSTTHSASAPVATDNTFHLANVPPGHYRVSVSPENVYVKSIRFGSVVVDGPMLDLSQGAAGRDLSILISSATGSVTGTVRDDTGSPGGTFIVLAPADGEWANRYANAEADGSWSIGGLAPGSYRLLAVPAADASRVMQRGGLEDYSDVMESLEIHPSDKLTKELKRISR